MVANNPEPAATTTAHRIVIKREFDAPRTLVWKAWTEPARLMKWLCPAGFTVLFAEADVRVGGKWRSGMRSPEGGQYIHTGVYQRIEEPGLLVFTHKWEKNDLEPAADTLITVTLTERGGKTVMVFEHVGFATVESGESHRRGWTGAFDNLAETLTDGAD